MQTILISFASPEFAALEWVWRLFTSWSVFDGFHGNCFDSMTSQGQAVSDSGESQEFALFSFQPSLCVLAVFFSLV